MEHGSLDVLGLKFGPWTDVPPQRFVGRLIARSDRWRSWPCDWAVIAASIAKMTAKTVMRTTP